MKTNLPKTNPQIWLGAVLTVAVLFFASAPAALAQWTTSGNNISNTNSGNVGVGTSTPAYRLDVLVNAQWVARFKKSDSTNGGIIIEAATGYNPKVALAVNGTNKWFMHSNSGSSDTLQFLDSGGNARFTLTQTGNVGIGTTSPTQLLDVSGQMVTTGNQNLTVANKGVVEVTNTITNNANAVAALRARNIFNGNGNIPEGLDVVPTFAPSTSIATAYGGLLGAFFAPPSSVTITDAIALSSVSVYSNVSGAVTTGTTSLVDSPMILGSLKPTTQYGIRIKNQGTSGMATNYGLYVDSQSGATNNYAAIFAGGNVGIGTTSPNARLTVSANTGIPPTSPTGTVGYFANVDGTNTFLTMDSYMGGAGGAQHSDFLFRAARGTLASPTASQADDIIGQIQARGYGTTGFAAISRASIRLLAAENWSDTAQGAYLSFLTTPKTTATVAEAMRITDAGNVGIGLNPNVLYKLDVNGPVNATGLSISGIPITHSASDLSSGTVAIGRLGSSGTASATTFLRGDNTWAVPSGATQWNNGTSSISYSGGNVGIGKTDPQVALDVVGSINVTGNINAKFQDIAEWVPSAEQLPIGTVVVLDSTRSNQVISSTQAYDTRVAGVISEQPGIALGESGAGKVLVATTGRVRVNVDAMNSPIHIGDLLVTSDLPGVAMKSEPVNVGGVQLHRPGTLIGKALEPLDKGSGRILVLLSLQ
jgi:hypothetical protein